MSSNGDPYLGINCINDVDPELDTYRDLHREKVSKTVFKEERFYQV